MTLQSVERWMKGSNTACSKVVISAGEICHESVLGFGASWVEPARRRVWQSTFDGDVGNIHQEQTSGNDIELWREGAGSQIAGLRREGRFGGSRRFIPEMGSNVEKRLQNLVDFRHFYPFREAAGKG